MNKISNAGRLCGVLLASMACAAGLGVLSGCSPMMAGQVAEAGYSAARNTFGIGDLASASAAERQQKLQAIMNAIEIGQDVQPVLEQIGEPPKIKSGNTYGYTCYEFPSVYSADEAAVILAREGRVVFYGSSRCSNEMQDANFRQDGKYTHDEPAATE
jgi:hypothetical protein